MIPIRILFTLYFDISTNIATLKYIVYNLIQSISNVFSHKLKTGFIHNTKKVKCDNKKHLTKNDSNCSNVELPRVQRLLNLKYRDHKQANYDR